MRQNLLFFCQRTLQHVFSGMSCRVARNQETKLLITSNEHLESVIISNYIKWENIKRCQWFAKQLVTADMFVRKFSSKQKVLRPTLVVYYNFFL